MSIESAKDTRILVIDDDPVVHKLLAAMLRREGYLVISADDGRQGLDMAHKFIPDLILLDVMMPDMDGYLVVSTLKGDADTKEIPVIFVSAKDESSDRVLGLELGAADFIKKPFDRAELIVRVKTQLKLKRQEMELRDYSRNLEEMVAERTQMLIHADRLASLGTLSAGIAHEINNSDHFHHGQPAGPGTILANHFQHDPKPRTQPGRQKVAIHPERISGHDSIHPIGRRPHHQYRFGPQDLQPKRLGRNGADGVGRLPGRSASIDQ